MKTINPIYLLCFLVLSFSCKKEKPLEAEATLDLFQITGTDYASCALEVDGETWIPVSSLKNNGDWTSHIMRFTQNGKHLGSHQIDLSQGMNHRIHSIILSHGKLCLAGELVGSPIIWVCDTSNWNATQAWGKEMSGRIYHLAVQSGNLLATGEYVSTNGEPKESILVRLDNTYSPTQERILPSVVNSGGIQLAIDAGNIFWLTFTYEPDNQRNILIYQLDQNLNTVDSNLIELSGYDQASDLIVEQDRILVFAHSTSNNTGTHDALILELDLDLNVLQKKFISLGDHEGVDAVRVLNNGNYGLVSYGDMQIRSGLYIEVDQKLNLIYNRRYPDVSGFFYLSEDSDRRVFWGQTNGPDLQLARVSDVFP